MTNIVLAEKSKIHDAFNRKEFVNNIVSFIRMFADKYENGAVISITGGYGSGKSVVVDLLKESLETGGHNPITCVKLDVWKMDYATHPLGVFVHGLLEELGKYEEASIKDVVEGFGKAAWGAVKGVAPIVGDALINVSTLGLNVAANVSISQIIEQMKDGAINAVELKQDDAYKLYSLHSEMLKKIKVELKKLVDNLPENKLIIIVDEMDRARPNFSVEMLEIIKHLFCVKGVVFVLSVDKVAMASSIQPLYGPIPFESYFLKFIDREYTLPKVEDYFGFIKNTISRELGLSRASNDCEREISVFAGDANVLLKSFKVKPREISFLLKIIADLMRIQLDANTNLAIFFYLLVAYTDPKRFESFDGSNLIITEIINALDFYVPQTNADIKAKIVLLFASSENISIINNKYDLGLSPHSFGRKSQMYQYVLKFNASGAFI